MQIFVSIELPEDTLGYLEHCVAQLSLGNKRLPIQWYDRSRLVAHLVQVSEVEEGVVPDMITILDTEARLQQPFFVGLTAPELLFKKTRPVAIRMKLYDQSGSLNVFKDLVSNHLTSLRSIKVEVIEPSILLGKVKHGQKPRRKIHIESGHIDSVFPVNMITLLERKPTPIGVVYTTLHKSKIGTE
jgi:2'-5' RNA ligase